MKGFPTLLTGRSDLSTLTERAVCSTIEGINYCYSRNGFLSCSLKKKKIFADYDDQFNVQTDLGCSARSSHEHESRCCCAGIL